jgi:hypothetical protein
MLIPVGSQDTYQLAMQVDKDTSGKVHELKLFGGQVNFWMQSQHKLSFYL